MEGADGSGRSTQIARLVAWLEGCGHATSQVGLKRSTLVSEELGRSPLGHYLFGAPGWRPDGKGLTTRELRAQAAMT